MRCVFSSHSHFIFFPHFGKYIVKRVIQALCIAFFAVFSGGGAFAQNIFHDVEDLLNTPALNYAQATRFVLEAAEISASKEAGTVSDAFHYALEQGWLPKKASPDAPARLDSVSLLIMRAFDFQGGLFYSIVHNAHYSYRELLYKRIIQGRTDPAMPVSGNLLLFMVSQALAAGENADVDS
ncbi:hypothetical protein FACS1894161_5030 [Spirochaetia bacterium]|nr:hypothetical protein FACS1894161_5030 [Spirochaetia bacterium]